ncbi:hypothetical protein OROHE_014538 [Orobanche hederae]
MFLVQFLQTLENFFSVPPEFDIAGPWTKQFLWSFAIIVWQSDAINADRGARWLASDSGRIPEFIGNMKLRVLRLQGKAFEGPIPTSFSNLTTIEELMVSDLFRGSSSLEFLINLKSLIRLNISLNVKPSDFKFLGNNKLVSSLPAQLSASLPTTDLSYNELSGDFPSWVSQNNLNLTLVANNFTIGDPNSSAVVHKLNLPVRFFTKPTMRLLGQQRWAVSNVVLPTDATNPLMYKTSAVGQYGNTNDSELLQSSRVSAASLRYYGLRFENGNYTLNLQFAEGLIQDPPSYESTGRRMFDVYIQGNQVLRDFDVRREAGGSFRAVRRNFQVQVSENFMEIHFFWVGKGTCCIPYWGMYGPTISAISATPRNKAKNRNGLIVGLVMGVGTVCFFSLFVVYFIVRNRKRRSSYEDEEEGTFSDERIVAVKKLSVASNQGKSHFVAEVALLYLLLDKALFGKTGVYLDWPKRFEECLGVARGLLAYLHEESSVKIVHKDIKASNILLDSKLNPKISDFGLAKLYDENMTHEHPCCWDILAPEYAMCGHLMKKADVFSFGILALEIISGRPGSNSNMGKDERFLLEWAWKLHESNLQLELVGKTLLEFNEDEVKRVIGVSGFIVHANITMVADKTPQSRVKCLTREEAVSNF